MPKTTEDLTQFTRATALNLKLWGWKFLGVNFDTDPQWYKYEKDVLVAEFGDAVWSRTSPLRVQLPKGI